MSGRSSLVTHTGVGIRASSQGQVLVLKGATVGKSEQAIRILRPPCAHVPMQHQAGWQPPIITR